MSRFSPPSTPGGYSQGTQDNSRTVVTAEPKRSSMTLSYIPILAKKGRSKATISTTGASVLYGAESFQKDSPYFTHANKLLAKNTSLGVPSLVKRIIPEDAKKALLRLSVELIASDNPLYDRNSDGTIKMTTDSGTGISTPVVLGTIQSTRAVLHVGVGGYLGDAQTFKQGNIVDDYRDGSVTVGNKFLGEITRADGSKEHPKSRLFPIADFLVDSEGNYGDNLGLRLSVPTLMQANPADASNVVKNRAFPLRVTVMERDDANSTPSPVAKIDSDYTQDLYFKSRASDVITGKNISLARRFVESYSRKETKELTPIWGPFGDVHVYEKNVNEIQQILSEGYIYTDSDGNDIAIKGERDYDADAMDYGRTADFAFGNSNNYGYLNFLTAKDINNVPYYTLSVADSLLFGGIIIDETATHYASGGDDGLWYLADGSPAELLNAKVFDDAVRANLTNFGKGEDTLKDILRYPITNFIDSGWSMETKLAASAILTARPDVWLVIGTKSVAEKGVLPVDIGPVYRGKVTDANKEMSSTLLDNWNWQDELTADQDLALATKIKTHYSLFPESTFFGTPVMRVVVCGSSGDDVDEEYNHPLPGSYDRGLAMNSYTQVTAWEPANDFTENDNRKPQFLKNMVYHWREDEGYDQAWDAGMNFLRSHDTSDDFWPAMQTIYPYKDSVLASARFMMVASKCHYFGMEVWRSISGENKTDLQFKQDLETEALRLITGVFPSDIRIIPVADLSEADKARHYSGNLKFHIGIGSMRTKLTYSVHGYTLDQLTAMQGLLAPAA